MTRRQRINIIYIFILKDMLQRLAADRLRFTDLQAAGNLRGNVGIHEDPYRDHCG